MSETRTLILGTIAGMTILLGLPIGHRRSTATSSPLATSLQEKGMTAGRPFTDPPDADTASSSHLTVTLDAAATRLDLGGRPVWGESYNGTFVAPTLHLTPGQDVNITLVNHLAVATNLHFHGLHVSPSDNSDDPFLCVAPGQTFTYHLMLPADHPEGTFWYHSHAMGTTCPPPNMAGMDTSSAPGDVENQIFAGLSGALVVGDNRSLLPADLQHVTAHTLVFKDVQIDHAGRIVQNAINSNAPTVRLVNGQLQPVLTMQPGETQLWRLVNAGADIFYQLHLDGSRFTIIAQDGRPATHITTADRLVLAPAKRYDVLVTAPIMPARTWLRTLPYSNGAQGDSYPNVPLVQVSTVGPTLPPAPSVTGGLSAVPADLSDATIAQRRTVILSENSAGTSFFINNAQFSMNTSAFATPAKLGTVEEWTILNTSGEDHPFHLHTNAFQVMSIDGVPHPYLGRQDIIPVPHAISGKPGRIIIRIPFADYPGRWMFHCHIAAHEDNGMMSYINVVP
jgi:FtsP/CotA-like multicopper oxidase with cupredoxin domain